MEMLTKIDAEVKMIDSIEKLNEQIIVEKTSVLHINNKSETDVEKEITFDLSENANFDFTLFDTSVASKATYNINFNLKASSILKVVIVSLNSNISDNQITVNLNEANSEADVNVISVANSGSNTKFNVVCNNNAPHTNGNITQRAVALNGGQNVFEATGYIGPDCAKAVNFQESRVLLLDGAAKGDASPILLINHHDVEAGHAAGVSRVSDEEMYYLMSRGIDRHAAEELMTVAFIRPVVDKITNVEMRESVFEKISEKASYETN